ncbi:dipeptidase [Brevibacterium sp. 91QC2O2]|jgi:membrane dipeptidase|uniref:dipeptidase n=1 Tax=Brevibacterium sp. 91QC2O2 TaxID=2968458 RepID=UPI00211C2C47|nr:dipeptidase [Brevibacterium sp. 91QC2O2]MCQ9367297.1 dipeptidase [Brevibacterium sp. 91QC2O2]
MTLVFDGHNDLAWYLREECDSDIAPVNDPQAVPMTTLDQLREGEVAAQFWSVYVDSAISGPAAVTATLEQIDMVHRIIAAHPDRLVYTPTAADIRAVWGSGRTASLMGAEGGQQIDESLGVLRAYARLGVRYMTLAWSTTHSWADSATDEPIHHGLSEFGKQVVAEMDRIGMIPDLSHVSADVMHQVLDQTQLPVVFTHSCVADINPHPRNVPTDVIDRLPANGGVLGITFVPAFVSAERHAWAQGGSTGPEPEVTVAQVADHCDWVRNRIGAQYLALGADLCGTDSMPTGLENAGKYQALFTELRSRGWSEAELDGIGGLNLLRVLEAHDPAYLAEFGARDEAADA